MIDIITSYSKPYSVMLHTEGLAYELSCGFTNKAEANKNRTMWRQRWRNLPLHQKSELLSHIRNAITKAQRISS